MARMSNEERLAKVHQEAIADFDLIQSAQRDIRLQCLEDRRFYSIAGAMWEGKFGEQFENKPKMEFNKIHLAVIRIFSEYRNNRITVDYVSKDGAENDDLADTCDGLYRADEQDSCAEEAYDNSFEEAVGGGYGAFRLRTSYEDEEDDENEHQRIRIEPIFDADSTVFFDLDAKRQDKSDAKRCYVLTSMSRGAYKEEYSDDPASWPKDIQGAEFDWATPDVVFVCEHYRVEQKRETVYVYKRLDGEEERYSDSDFENDDDLREELAAIGTVKVREKKVTRRRVHKYILSGGKVLEDCGYIAGKHIPIVPVYGKRWFVDNIERCMGHVRLAKDAQRLKNMQLSKLAELSALSSVEKPYFTPEQVAGHSVMHSEDNLKNYPYLLVNPMLDQNGQPMPAGPIGYTRVPNIPPAMAALLQITEQDMRDVLGNQENGDKIVSNVSEKTVGMIQERLDMQTFIYVSNMAKAIRRAGEIWLSMARDVYVEAGRKMKSIGAQGEVGSIELMRPVLGKSGETVKENDLSSALFDVVADVGPSSNSKRAATVRSLTGMMQITQDPETMQVLGAMAMLNMEGEGIGDVRDWFRKKLLNLGVVKPTEAESKEMAEAQENQKPDPNALYMEAAAEEASANATSARAKTVLTVAQADKTKAETIKVMSEVDANEQAQAMEVIERFGQGPEIAQQPVQAVVADSPSV